VQALADRLRAASTAVLYAGICAVTGFVSRLDRAFLQLTLGNRGNHRTRSAVGMFTQDVVVPVDLRDAELGDVIVRANAAILGAMRFGAYPTAELLARRRDVEHDRGVALDLSCWLNDLGSTTPAPGTGGRPDRRSLAAAAARSGHRVLGSDPNSTCTYFVYADQARDVLRLTALVDTSVLSTGEAIGWLRAAETLLCAAVTEEVGTSEIGDRIELRPDPRGPEWHRSDAGWAHLPAVLDLVRLASGQPLAEVRLVDDQLVAHLTSASGLTTAADLAALHARCVGLLPGRRTAVAPRRYVLHAGAPTGPVLIEGSGRAAHPARA
jgi:hypothetical protein